jgi:alpha-ketoglutarate-dependent taurine dioxygenase
VTSPPVFRHATARLLSRAERSRSTSSDGTPLVLEPNGRADLAGFLSDDADAVTEAIFAHGAVLLRGFTVRSERDLADGLSSSRRFRPMTGCFLSEPGRDSVPGAADVFATNTYYKTGGGFSLRGFHSEGYFHPDVPAFVAFWCKRAPWLGGETAAVHMANAYQELSEGCRERLEGGGPCVVLLAPLEPTAGMIADRYGLSPAAARDFCVRNGLTMVLGDRVLYGFHKPTVSVHPQTGRRSLQINLSGELPEIDSIIRANLLSHYSSGKWLLHRLVWQHPALEKVAETYEAWASLLAMAASRPRAFAAEMRRRLANRVARRPPPPSRDHEIPAVTRLHDKLRPEDIKEIADAVCRHCCLFEWRDGDVLLLDNLQMLHCGMPGYGPRVLRAMMLNPIPFTFPVDRPMLQVPGSSDAHEPFSMRIEKLRER